MPKFYLIRMTQLDYIEHMIKRAWTFMLYQIIKAANLRLTGRFVAKLPDQRLTIRFIIVSLWKCIYGIIMSKPNLHCMLRFLFWLISFVHDYDYVAKTQYLATLMSVTANWIKSICIHVVYSVHVFRKAVFSVEWSTLWPSTTGSAW